VFAPGAAPPSQKSEGPGGAGHTAEAGTDVALSENDEFTLPAFAAGVNLLGGGAS
jgi:hypothetical protein